MEGLFSKIKRESFGAPFLCCLFFELIIFQQYILTMSNIAQPLLKETTMSTSRFAFMTPTRLSDQEHPHIRAFVHNLRTGAGSKIQAIKTSLYHAYVENDVTKHDTIVLGHYDVESSDYINIGEFSTMELGDWVITDIPTYQEGNVAEYLHSRKIENHYNYLHYMWEDFHKAVFGKTASESFRGGMIGAHGDKVYGYCDEWEEKNIPFYRGALLYLLTYIESEMVGYKKSQSSEFVIDKYQHYLPKIIEAEKMQLIKMVTPSEIS